MQLSWRARGVGRKPQPAEPGRGDERAELTPVTWPLADATAAAAAAAAAPPDPPPTRHPETALHTPEEGSHVGVCHEKCLC